MFHSELDIMLRKSGIPRMCTEGMYIYYYISPMNLLESSVDKYSKASYFMLDIEQSDVDKPNAIPLTSHISIIESPTADKPFEYTSSLANISNYPLQYVLNLHPPVLLSTDVLKQVLFPSQNFGNTH